jgi:hypothetical protein
VRMGSSTWSVSTSPRGWELAPPAWSASVCRRRVRRAGASGSRVGTVEVSTDHTPTGAVRGAGHRAPCRQDCRELGDPGHTPDQSLDAWAAAGSPALHFATSVPAGSVLLQCPARGEEMLAWGQRRERVGSDEVRGASALGQSRRIRVGTADDDGHALIGPRNVLG